MYNQQKLQLIRALLKKRAEKSFVARLLGNVESLFEYSDVELMGSPEATVVTIVETYLELHHQGVPDDEIFEAIERHRQTTGRGQLPKPLNLDSYIKYRLRIEHRSRKRMNNEEIDFAIFAARNFLVEFLRPSNLPEVTARPPSRALSFEIDPSFQITGNMPDVTQSEPIRAFRAADYMILFLKDVLPVAEQLGSNPMQLRFTYVMIVVDTATRRPVYFVTLEKSMMGANFLCTLNSQGGHANLGVQESLSNEEAFLTKALSLIKQELGVDHIEELKR